MTTRSDDELIAAHRRGEEAALEGLVGRYLRIIGAYCYQLTLNRDSAEDLAQETFVRALRSLETFRGKSSFKTWLFQIATNLVRDSWSRNRKEVALDENGELTPEFAAPDGRALERELDAAIQAGLAELPLPLRTALVLTAIQGLAPQEVADLEDCTVGTIYWRVHEARKLMKRRLQAWTS